jgi:hypothetical protein
VVHNLGEVTGDHCGIDISKLSDVVDPSIVMLNVSMTTAQCDAHFFIWWWFGDVVLQ